MHMFRNYLLVTFRSLYKNRMFAFINILGLGVALSVCIVAYFNHMFGYEFDRGHEHFEEIYRVTCYRRMQDSDQEYGLIPAPLGPDLKKEVPAVLNAARIMRSYSPVKVGTDVFNRQISYVDPEFLEIFTFHMKSGNRESISDPNNVLISGNMAMALFGDRDPIGQSLSIFNDGNEEFIFTVSGVFSDLPLNSSFRIDILSHLDNFLAMWDVSDTEWQTFARALFLRVQDPSALPVISDVMKRYIPVQNRANESFIITGFNIVPLDDVGENTRNTWNSGLFPGLHPAAVLAPMVMAILVLLIACFNFANTAIASAGRRLMEIGLRKVAGGLRRQILVQFLLENYIICFLALLFGILGATFLVPAYGSLWDYMILKLTFTGHWGFWLFLLLLLLLTGLLAGIYPALYISSFRPLEIFRGRTHLGSGGPLSKILLGLQLSISMLAIVSGVIFSRNAVYQETMDMGYARDELIVIPIQPKNFKSFYEAISRETGVVHVAGIQNHVSWGWYRRSVEDEQNKIEVCVMDVGPEYPEAMGFEVLGGRVFDPARLEADRGVSIVINRMMADAFGWEDPVGRQVRMYDTVTYHVIGVVKDFYINGVWSKIEPTMMKLPPDDTYYGMVVRTGRENLPGVLRNARETWGRMFPNYPFEGSFQEDLLQEGKDINRSIKQIYLFLAIVATLLSMTGLYTLLSLSILNRTKEIGIRKVIGSPVPNLILVLSRGFLIILALACAAGCVGGYLLSEALLKSIWVHYLDFTASIYIYAVLIILGITMITMAGKIFRAARLNPTECLRYE